MNGYDTVIPYAQAISGLGWGFDVVSDEVFEDLDLSSYALIIWIAGEESSVDTTVTRAQQEIIASYLDAGGKLFMSGSEILWDLDQMGDALDISFAENYLGALLDVDSSETYSAFGVGLLDGLSLNFSIDDGAPYDVDYPDVLLSSREPNAYYDTGQLAGVSGNGVILLGFPFETIGNAAERHELMSRVLNDLMPELPNEEESVVDLDDGTPKEEIGACACSSTNRFSMLGFVYVLFVTIVSRRRISLR